MRMWRKKKALGICTNEEGNRQKGKNYSSREKMRIIYTKYIKSHVLL